MLDRVAIKYDIRQRLRGNWFMLFVGIFLSGLVIVIVNAILIRIPALFWLTGHATPFVRESIFRIDIHLTPTYNSENLVSFLIAGPLAISLSGFFLRFLRGEQPSLASVFACFHFYGRALAASFRKWIFIFLWSLLLVIPGIVKAYSYMMIPYIVSDCPNIGAKKAMQTSMRMTQGFKGDLFVMQLSFIGWLLLSALTWGILYIWVGPYILATRAAFYGALKGIALNSGRLQPEDFEPDVVGFT